MKIYVVTIYMKYGAPVKIKYTLHFRKLKSILRKLNIMGFISGKDNCKIIITRITVTPHIRSSYYKPKPTDDIRVG